MKPAYFSMKTIPRMVFLFVLTGRIVSAAGQSPSLSSNVGDGDYTIGPEYANVPELTVKEGQTLPGALLCLQRGYAIK
jgi:hypothetical protein